jgi:hypothetical protein
MHRWLTLTIVHTTLPRHLGSAATAPLDRLFVHRPAAADVPPTPTCDRAFRHRVVDGGLTVSELLIVTALLGVAAVVATPRLAALHRETSLRCLTSRLGAQLASCRAHAIFHRTNTGLVFERACDGSWRCFIAEDGDGDGILRRDLDSGRDPVVGEIVQLSSGGSSPGILDSEPVPDPLGDGVLAADDPIRAGRGDIISFTPAGTATASSIYLTDHHSAIRVLRVLGTTGRVRSLVWRRGWAEWKQSWW